MKTEFRTNRNRKLTWTGKYSASGKSLRCYTKRREPIFISLKTGESVVGQNSRSRRNPRPATHLLAENEFIPLDAIANAIGEGE